MYNAYNNNCIGGLPCGEQIKIINAFGGFQGGLVLPIGTSHPESLTRIFCNARLYGLVIEPCSNCSQGIKTL